VLSTYRDIGVVGIGVRLRGSIGIRYQCVSRCRIFPQEEISGREAQKKMRRKKKKVYNLEATLVCRRFRLPLAAILRVCHSLFLDRHIATRCILRNLHSLFSDSHALLFLEITNGCYF
jgi:hypothetical protein